MITYNRDLETRTGLVPALSLGKAVPMNEHELIASCLNEPDNIAAIEINVSIVSDLILKLLYYAAT